MLSKELVNISSCDMANIVVSDNDFRVSIVIKIDLASKADVGSSNNNIVFFRTQIFKNFITISVNSDLDFHKNNVLSGNPFQSGFGLQSQPLQSSF